MKTVMPYLIFVFLFFSSCGQTSIKSEEKFAGKKKQNNIVAQISDYQKESKLYHSYLLFRSNDYSASFQHDIANALFFSALSNEFIHLNLSNDKDLSNAIIQYEGLTNSYSNESGFLFQRIGIIYFKMKNYSKAYENLNLALSTGLNNSELFYYKAILLFYYKKDYAGAEYYLNKIGKDAFFLNNQDIRFILGCIKYEKKEYDAAYSIFMSAKDINPQRFYKYHDLLPYLVRGDILLKARDYISDSFRYLTSLSNKNYRFKAYNQLVMYNRLQNKETLIFSFNLPGNYNYYTNLLYYSSRNYPGIDKWKSRDILSPLQEKKRTNKDKIYLPLFEEYADLNNESSVFLLEGILMQTNISSYSSPIITPVTKIFFVSNMMVLLSPTNLYEIITNTNAMTNSRDYIISNAANAFYITNCSYDFYYDARIFDVNNDSSWDFVTIGITSNNQAAVSIFYPKDRKFETYRFSIKRYDSLFVIQDINNDNKPEIILLDEDINILKPKKEL